MYKRKIIMSILVHIAWMMILVVTSIKLINGSPKIYMVMNESYMVMLVYPIIANVLVFLIKKIKPLDSIEENRKYTAISLKMTVFILLCCLPSEIARVIYWVSK